ncbi:BTAD domain-containing putative transcriptional regulator [Streptomyces sp. NPDC001530]|uniref:AfsR/SARP family transcriptional regulator n=1 Tax=Streptomyces sp. NPDC001530 TaxID=3364582 RepID=UPI00369EB7E7
MTTAEPLLRLCLLGGFRLEYGAAAVDVCAGGRRLLAYLGLHRHASRSVLAGTLWPDVTEERAHGSLRTTLWRLHRGRRPLVHSDQDTLSLADAVSVDAHAFTESALRIVRVPGSGAHGEELPRYLLYDGDLLPGWDEDWVLFERERLRQLRLHALDVLAAQLIAQGRHALALEAALESVRIEPLRESAHRAVVAVHLAENNVVEAIRHYCAFSCLLHEELGVEPSAHFTSMLPIPLNDR